MLDNLMELTQMARLLIRRYLQHSQNPEEIASRIIEDLREDCAEHILNKTFIMAEIFALIPASGMFLANFFTVQERRLAKKQVYSLYRETEKLRDEEKLTTIKNALRLVC